MGFIKVVAFDFDGVVAQTTNLKSELFLKMFEQHPKYNLVKDFESKFKSMPRRKKLEKLSVILGFRGDEEILYYMDFYKKLIEDNLYKTAEVEGVNDFISFLKKRNVPLYIVSAAIKAEIEKYLSLKNVYAFKDIYDFELEKKEALMQISKVENICSEELLFVGDQPSDYQAAVAAGCSFLGINSKNIFSTDPVVFRENFIFPHDEVLQEVLKYPVRNPRTC